MTPKTQPPARRRAVRRPSTDFYETIPMAAPAGGRFWDQLDERDTGLVIGHDEALADNPRAAEATAKRFAMLVLLLSALTVLGLGALLLAGLETAQHTLPPITRSAPPQM